MEIFELIYYSVASPALTRKDVFDILEISQVNNLANGITGCMLYHRDAFIQILEGEQVAVEKLYAKIEEDSRHYNVRKVYSDVKQDRLFKNWSMAFYDLENKSASEADLIFRKTFIAVSQHAEEPGIATELFWSISNQLLNEDL